MFLLKLIGGIFTILAGVGVSIFGNHIQISIMIVAGIPIAGVGIWLVKSSFHSGQERPKQANTTGKADKAVKPADNTMLISSKGIEWQVIQDPQTIPMRCRNNGHEYHVLRQVKEETEPLLIPDALEHYAPDEYGNVLSMPAHRKLFARRENLLQQIAPFALVGAMGVVAFLYVITAG